MRNDLPSMTTGRAMAQASHAANAFVFGFGDRKDVKAWQKETKQGFGTAIVLSASMLEIQTIFLNLSEPHDYVTDPEYGIKVNTEILELVDLNRIQDGKTIYNDDRSVIIFKEEITCAYIFGDKDGLAPILGHLKLHP